VRRIAVNFAKLLAAAARGGDINDVVVPLAAAAERVPATVTGYG